MEFTFYKQLFYLNTNTDFGEDRSLVAGARYEKFDQQLDYPNAPRASNELSYDDWYPAMNLTWRLTEEMQLRFGYASNMFAARICAE